MLRRSTRSPRRRMVPATSWLRWYIASIHSRYARPAKGGLSATHFAIVW